MRIGENIRDLRKNKDITREQLAAVLDVPLQSVCNWENGISMPDITVLPKLAAYFSVTIDSMLDYDHEEKTNEIKGIIRESFEYRESDADKSRRILEEGLKKYPDNDMLMNELLYTINYNASPDETIKVASHLTAITDKADIRYDAMRFLAYAYHAKGETDMAVAALEQVPQLYFTRLSEMAFITTGRRKHEAAEKQKWVSFETLLQMQWKLAECREEEDDIAGAVECIRRGIRLIDALADEQRIADFVPYREFFEKQLARISV